MSRVPARLAGQVRARAANRCEYCRLPVVASQAPFEVEHIIPRKHAGATEPANLALACLHCNRHKGVNISGLRYPGGVLVRLFHPRRDVWSRHFRVRDGWITGRTEIGRITVQILMMNNPTHVQLRRLWFTQFPP